MTIVQLFFDSKSHFEFITLCSEKLYTFNNNLDSNIFQVLSTIDAYAWNILTKLRLKTPFFNLFRTIRIPFILFKQLYNIPVQIMKLINFIKKIINFIPTNIPRAVLVFLLYLIIPCILLYLLFKQRTSVTDMFKQMTELVL